MNLHFKRARNYRLIATVSYFAIIALLPVLIIKNSSSLNAMILPFIIWWLPMLLAISGVIKGKTYTYGWVGFILVLPFFYAFYFITEADKFRWSLVIIILSIICFLASVFYIKKFALAHGIKTNKDAKKAKGLE